MKIEILKSESEKRELMHRLSLDNIELAIFIEEDPDESFVHRAIRPGLVVISPPYDFDALDRWWYYGNWQAIAPVDPSFEPFDAFRSTDEELKRKLDGQKIAILIDSFHDDTEWKVIEP